MSRLSRRAFLVLGSRAGAAALALGALPPSALRALAGTTAHASRVPDLIERNEWPEHWETTLEALGRSWITPNDDFFVRSHFPVPEIDAATYRLEVTGLVRKPISLALGEVRAMPAVESVHTLECAGNGRGLYALPSTSGTQWEYGAVGNAAWGGVKLSSLLKRAELLPEARHVWFEAADRSTLPQVPPFLRSIPIEKAMAGTLLAHTMNGQRLPARHGAPIRALVPGWYGMASTKWVTRVRVEAAPSDNHFMVKGYRYNYPGADPAATPPPVEDIQVKSLITRPLAGARVRGPQVVVEGFAWSGAEGVERVEVSADGGSTWKRADFAGKSSPLAWRSWRARIVIAHPATLTLMARATDGAGRVQPDRAKPNAAGYANNSIHRVVIDAKG